MGDESLYLAGLEFFSNNLIIDSSGLRICHAVHGIICPPYVFARILIVGGGVLQW